jgi:hypothetical protein
MADLAGPLNTRREASNEVQVPVSVTLARFRVVRPTFSVLGIPFCDLTANMVYITVKSLTWARLGLEAGILGLAWLGIWPEAKHIISAADGVNALYLHRNGSIFELCQSPCYL